MAKHGTITFTGKSGKSYEFTAYSWNTAFKAVGAVYVLTKRDVKAEGGGSHTQIYVGQTENLSTRFDNHHKATCCTKLNANCKCVMVEANEKSRLAIESDLILGYNPPCNG